jgi:hypothetical protein
MDHNELHKIQCPEQGCGKKADDYWVITMLKAEANDV